MRRKLITLALSAALSFSCAKVKQKDADEALTQARAAQSQANAAAAADYDPGAARIARDVLLEAELQKKEGARPKIVYDLAERARLLYQELSAQAQRPAPGVDVAKDQPGSLPAVQ